MRKSSNKLINERISFISDDYLNKLLDKYSKRGFKQVSGIGVDKSLKAGQKRHFEGKAIDGYALEFLIPPSKGSTPEYEYIAIFDMSMNRSFRGFPTWTVEQFELDNITSSPVAIGQGHLSNITIKALVARKFDPSRRSAEKAEKEAAAEKEREASAAKEAERQAAYDAERATWKEVEGFGVGGMKPGQKCKFTGSFTGYRLELDFPCSTHLFELDLEQGIRGTMRLPDGDADIWTFDETELNDMVGNKVYFAPGMNFRVEKMRAKPRNIKESKFNISSNAKILEEHNSNRKVHPAAKHAWWYDA